MSSTALVLILERILSKDRDFRYMATSDLLNELQKDTFKTDPELERKVCQVVLQQLDDSSGDVSGLAVRCLGFLVRRVSDARAEDMIKALCERVVSGKKDQQRDIASIGLKTVIAEIQGGQIAQLAAASITAKMIEGTLNKDNFEIVADSLDILTEVVSKYGHLVTNEHARLKDILLQHLDESMAALRKKALHCLAALGTFLSDDLLDQVLKRILMKLKQTSLKSEVVRTYIQAMGAISRTVGFRLGRHLPVAVPLLLEHCNKSGRDESDDEHREYCLQALESFVLRAANDCKPFLQDILPLVLRYLKYDPNYADDMEEEDEELEEADEEEIESEDEYSDDEDISWKVRRAAAKTLSAIIHNYPEFIMDIYRSAAGELVTRFREREENVKMDVFSAYVDIVRQVGAVSKRMAPSDENSPAKLLQQDIPAVVRSLGKQLRDKQLKTKVGVFFVLKELITVLPSSMADHVSTLVPSVIHALTEKTGSSNLKIEALVFLRLAITSSPPEVFRDQAAALTPALSITINERYYKVTAEAIRVCEQLVRVLRPDPSKPVDPKAKPTIDALYARVKERLSAQDQDQEVKECAIMCTAIIVSQLGDYLAAEVPTILKILLDRLRNEITRLTAVKAFGSIAQSPLAMDMSSVLEPALLELTRFLRMANRSLRQASLAALEALVSKYGAALVPGSEAQYVEAAAMLVNESDLSLSSLSFKFLVTLMHRQPDVTSVIVEKVLPRAMELVSSPLLQRGALESLQLFFCSLVPAVPLEALLAKLVDAGTRSDASRTAQHSIAQCIAVLSTQSTPAQLLDTIQKLLANLNKGRDPNAQRLALLALGEIGRRNDLSKHPQVEASIIRSLEADSEEIKSAASVALGGITCGSLPQFMPSLLKAINAQSRNPKQQYLLLQALNEVLSSTAHSASGKQQVVLAKPEQERALLLLLQTCEGEEECRNVVAECLGRLALLHPPLVLPALLDRVAAPSANARSVAVLAIKWTIVDKPHPADQELSSCILNFLLLIKDSDRHVRKAAVVALSAAAHHKASLISRHLGELLPLLYEQTVIRQDMIRTVDLGPFKHKIDDGLELRKAAFECLDILLDSCTAQIDTAQFLRHLESGLADHYDVKLPCHLTLVKLAHHTPASVLAALDRLCEPLEKTLTTKLKSDAVKQEVDRHEDMIRSCLRAVSALNHIPGVEVCTPLQAFMKRVIVGPLRDKYHQIEKERADAEGADVMDVA